MHRKLFEALYGSYAAAMFVIVVLLLFCPVLIVAPGLPLRRAIGRGAVRAWALCCFMPFRIRGAEHLPHRPCIVTCNHASYLDGILLTAALPSRFTFLVQHGAREWLYVGLIIRRMGVRFVDRGSARAAAQVTRELVERVRGGEPFAIFPEGTFRRAPELLPFQAGAFLIASRAGVPVVPAVLRGSRRIFGEGQKWLRWQPIEIEFFAPLHPDAHSRDTAHALRDAVRAVMLAHCGEADGLARDDAGPAPLAEAET